MDGQAVVVRRVHDAQLTADLLAAKHYVRGRCVVSVTREERECQVALVSTVDQLNLDNGITLQ